MTKRTLLIDGDIFAFKTVSAAQIEYNYEDGFATLWSNIDEVTATFDNTLAHLQEELDTEEMIIALSDASTNIFRTDFLPEYKQNRSSTKPLQYKNLIEHVEANYETKRIPRLEADDILAMLSTGPWVKGEKIIVSYDKDFLQVPGLFYQLSVKERTWELLTISEEDADVWFYQQTLIGDPVDNYKGCPGIGIKKAEQLITKDLTNAEKWAIIKESFEAKQLTEEDALAQARCARLLRAEDFDIEKQRAIPWEPTI